MKQVCFFHQDKVYNSWNNPSLHGLHQDAKKKSSPLVSPTKLSCNHDFYDFASSWNYFHRKVHFSLLVHKEKDGRRNSEGRKENILKSGLTLLLCKFPMKCHSISSGSCNSPKDSSINTSSETQYFTLFPTEIFNSPHKK